MIEDYTEIGEQIQFGGIIIQLIAMPRRQIRPVPFGEVFYPYKLGYKIIDWNEFTEIKDVYEFIKWQLQYEITVKFLNNDGKIIDKKPNSQWKTKHYEPLKKIVNDFLKPIQLSLK
jgi:hypothetical protein